MALTSSTQQEWTSFLRAAGLPAAQVTAYSAKFIDNRVSIRNIAEFERQDFRDLEITAIGDIKNIIQHAKSSNTDAVSVAPTPTVKPPTATLPIIEADMTKPQFRKFRIDWQMFKSSTGIPNDQVHSYLYRCCDPHVQSSLVSSNSTFSALPEEELINLLEGLVTKQSNPTVHRLHFSSMYQQNQETVKNFVLRLKSVAPDCSFNCHSCHVDQQEQHIRDQFIRGISNELLQTDILAKASSLTTLEAVVKHSEGFEAAQRDQSELQATDEVKSIRSEHQQRKRDFQRNRNPKPHKC